MEFTTVLGLHSQATRLRGEVRGEAKTKKPSDGKRG